MAREPFVRAVRTVKGCAVTGVGIASTLGVGADTVFAALRAGARAGVDRRIETFDASEYPGARVAEVRGFDAAQYLGEKGLRSLDRLTKLLIVAARMALKNAGLKQDGRWAAGSADSVGIVVSNAYGSLEVITELSRVAMLEDARYINPSRFPLTVANSPAGYVSIWEDIRAANVTISDGNCGALDAVGCAELLLSDARAGALLVGGAEAMSEALFFGFQEVGAIPPRRATAENNAPAETMFLGEGAALFVVETIEAANARGASTLAEILGYGTAFVAPEREGTLVHASPEAMQRAIAQALADADIDAKAIDVVVSGVCGLPAFDNAELLAIRRTLGDAVCVTAPKLAFGETLGAAGAMAMVAALALFEGATRLPTVHGTLPLRAHAALVLSMGYYGNASAVVMRQDSRNDGRE